MTMKYQRRIPEVDAIQFPGGEDSAVAIIKWADEIALTTGPEQPFPPFEVKRHLHGGSWNDKNPDLWMKIEQRGVTSYAAPGDWLVVDAGNVRVLRASDFDELFEPVAA